MSVRYPAVLLLLLLVPALLYLRHRRGGRPSIRFSDGAALARLSPGMGVLLQPLLPVLYGAGLMLLILALARPQKGLDESRVRTEAVDIVLLVDLSTSMRAIDFSTATEEIDRLAAAKRVIERFIKNRPNDRIGMVAFAAMPYSVSPLTLDHGWLLQQMERIETGMLEDGTAIGVGMASAINRLRDSKAKSKLIVLLTDGENNMGDLTPENAAEIAKALNIRIYTVGAGAEGWVKVPVQDPFGGKRYVRQPSRIDETTLKRIADVTGARFFRAQDLDGLNDVYEQIDRMEKTEIEVDQYTRYEEKFPVFLAISLLLLGAEKLLSLGRLGRLP
jgi:Ca-activated chloride channel homolog